MKASHLFNLLDARGVISVTERQAYIGRVRELAKGCCEAWLASQGAATSEAMPELLLELCPRRSRRACRRARPTT